MGTQTIKIVLVHGGRTEGNGVAGLLSSIESDEIRLELSSIAIAATHQLDLKRYNLCLLNSTNQQALTFLNEHREPNRQTPIIVISHTAHEALEALRSGASDALLVDGLRSQNLSRAVSDAVERTQRLVLLSKHEQRYLALVENTNEIIYCHDFEGNYTFMNPAGEQLTGYTCEEAIKLNAAQVVAPEYHNLVQEMIKGKLEGREPSPYEIEIITREGRRLPLEVSSHLIYSDGAPIGVQGVARDISQRRQRDAVLVESEHRYRQLVNEATDIIYRIDLAGHFTFVNPIATKLMQRPTEELVGLHFLELIHETYRTQASDFYRRQVKERIPVTYFEFPAVTTEGAEVWIGQNVQLLMRNSKPIELQAVARDITARKRIEEELAESERRYRSLFDASPNPMLVYDCKTLVFLAANDAAIRAYDYSREELLSLKANSLWRTRDLPFLCGDVVAETCTAGTLPGTCRHQRKDGTTIDVEITSQPITLEGREAVIVIATDVTERVRAEAERQVMLDVTQSVNLTQDLDQLLKSVHESLKKVLYAENCFVALYNHGTKLFEMPFFVDSSDPVCHSQKMEKSCAAYVFRTGQPILITPNVFKRLATQGEIELVGTPSPSWLGVPLKTPAETIGVLAVQHYEDENAYADRDLQFLSSIGGQIALAIERKRAEEGLRLSEERFSKAFNFTPLSMSLTSLSDMRIIDVNNSFLALNGYQREDVIGRTAQELNLWAVCAEEQLFLEILKLNRSVRDREIKVPGKDGSLRTILISAEIIDLHGEECILALTNDITEHRALEEQLRQAQRMESIGQLAGGVAHDFNNLLTAITGYSEISLRRLGIKHPVSRNIEQIQKAGTRAAGLTRQLLAFSRRQILEAKVLDLNTLVADMDKMLQRLIGEDIALVSILKPDLGQIKADPGQIEQVLLNLVVNARDAMPRGGKITIETSNTELDQSYARNHVYVVPGPYVLLAISDTGTGMDAATQKRIFEPFFTTKEVGKGTGLGLSTAYGIVKQSSGYIWVYSEVAKGTAFKVYLPRVDQSSESEAATAPREAPRGDEIILLVEDEEQLRNLAKQILEESGYTVIVAGNGVEGLRICRDFSGSIDLLISDVVMPLMSGRELAEILAGLRPQTKVLYISGYTDDSVVRHGVLEHHTFFLQKPFTPLSLAHKVREVLDGK